MRQLFATFTRFTALLLFPLFFGLSAQAAAVDVFTSCADPQAQQTDVCQNVKDNSSTEAKDNPIIGAIKLTITILSIIIGFTAVVMIIVAGLSFITANGDAQAIAKARGSIIYALVGIVIVGIAQALVAFVLNKI